MERKATKAGSQKKKKKQQIRTEPQKVQGSLNLLACSWHFLCLCIYVAIYWYDDKIYRECPKPDVYFKDSDTFGGRWKYLTAITLVRAAKFYFLFSINIASLYAMLPGHRNSLTPTIIYSSSLVLSFFSFVSAQ